MNVFLVFRPYNVQSQIIINFLNVIICLKPQQQNNWANLTNIQTVLTDICVNVLRNFKGNLKLMIKIFTSILLLNVTVCSRPGVGGVCHFSKQEKLYLLLVLNLSLMFFLIKIEKIQIFQVELRWASLHHVAAVLFIASIWSWPYWIRC